MWFRKLVAMMMILRVAIPSPLRKTFDYLPCTSETRWVPGVRVKVPFGTRQVVGIVVEVADHSTFAHDKLKQVSERIDEAPILPQDLLTLCTWASTYYQCPIGEVVFAALPKLARLGRADPEAALDAQVSAASDTPLPLNAPQREACDAITHCSGYTTFLLDGVTGSGKTEVYLQVIAAQLAQKRQALVLVPEISLTPQTLARFQRRFDAKILCLHSRLTDKARFTAWMQAAAGEADIVIGTRSAIFTPMPRLGVMILDEEHDTSFKQQSGFRYSARDLAVMRASHRRIPLVLGSATPSLESLHNVQRGRYQRLSLPERAGSAKPPKIELIDLKNRSLESGLSDSLLQHMRRHLAAKGQVLLFLNRRGYAPILMCHHCGWMAHCDRCDARLTFHLAANYLFCHHCEVTRPVPHICQSCHQGTLLRLGLGTERIEEALSVHFPDHQVVRIDRDTTQRKGAMDRLLSKMHSGEADICIGTQMVAKGHHFANLTMVAVVDADAGLFSADFRSLERLGQLLVQVSGRAGREDRIGEVFIQTHHPDHPLLQCLLEKGYGAFAEALLQERQAVALPPYHHWALLRADAKVRETAWSFLNAVKASMQTSPQLGVLGPVPAIMERKADRFHAQLLIQSGDRPTRQDALDGLVQSIEQLPEARKVRWSLDVDPQDMY